MGCKAQFSVCLNCLDNLKNREAHKHIIYAILLWFQQQCCPRAELHSHCIRLTSIVTVSISDQQLFLLRSTFHKIERKLRKCTRFYLPGEIKLQERAICMAVFCLSPVSIQKLIPAFRSVSIVSGTPSWGIILQWTIEVSEFFIKLEEIKIICSGLNFKHQRLNIPNKHTCRRSSIAVTPRISRSCSSLWQTSASLH